MNSSAHHQHVIQTAHLFPVLDEMLISLLRELRPEEWQLPTVAKKWIVEDVAAHLLDGHLRGLSMGRDGFLGEKPERLENYNDLVDWLNKLNMSWNEAAKNVSVGGNQALGKVSLTMVSVMA